MDVIVVVVVVAAAACQLCQLAWLCMNNLSTLAKSDGHLFVTDV